MHGLVFYSIGRKTVALSGNRFFQNNPFIALFQGFTFSSGRDNMILIVF